MWSMVKARLNSHRAIHDHDLVFPRRYPLRKHSSLDCAPQVQREVLFQA